MTSVLERLISGEWHQLTGAVSYLLAAVMALRIGWLPRSGSQWLPDDEAVPKVFTFIATPVIAIIFAIEYRFLGNPLLPVPVTLLTCVWLVLGLIGLFTTTYIMKRYGMPARRKTLFGREVGCVRLGGHALTPEALLILANRPIPWTQLFEEAGANVYTVFTQVSIANIHTRAQIFYLLFEISGPLALCGAGLLLTGS